MRRVVTRLLARLRVPLGFTCAALVFWAAHPSFQSLALGVGVALLGESLRIWAAGHLNKAREVTTSGPYRWFAHPLYVGSSIMGLGLAIACASIAVAAVIAGYLGLTLPAAIWSEEKFLQTQFGDQYASYRRGSADNDDRRFSMEQAITNHEHRSVAGLVAAIALLAAKAWRRGG